MPSFLHFSWNFGIFLLKRACVRAIVYKQRFLASVWFCFGEEWTCLNFRLHVGWRNIKTSVTAMLVAMVYCLIGRNPAFACIGVIVALLVNYFLPRERVVALWEGFKKRIGAAK